MVPSGGPNANPRDARCASLSRDVSGLSCTVNVWGVVPVPVEVIFVPLPQALSPISASRSNQERETIPFISPDPFLLIVMMQFADVHQTSNPDRHWRVL
jgi:hypothetical protein